MAGELELLQQRFWRLITAPVGVARALGADLDGTAGASSLETWIQRPMQGGAIERLDKRWRLSTLLRAVLGGLLAGARSLADVEIQSERLSRPLRRLLGARRRVADTTLRDALCSLEPDELRKPLHALVYAAQRRKSLAPDELPFGVVSSMASTSACPLRMTTTPSDKRTPRTLPSSAWCAP